MLKKTAKTVLFVGLCALALGMASTPHANRQKTNKTSVSSKANVTRVTTCGCHHKAINLIGECANPDCPYYYGTLDW